MSGMIMIMIIMMILIIGGFFFIVNRFTKGRKGEESLITKEIDRFREVQTALLEQQRRASEDQIKSLKEDFEKKLDEIRKESELREKGFRQEATIQLGKMAEEALSSNSAKIREQNQEQIGNLLNPLQQKIDEFSKAVKDSYVHDNATRQSLSDQITRLMEMNRTISDEAHNLTSALKGNTKTQGDWGEMMLETILEQTGMQKNINYFVQVGSDASGNALKDDNGHRLRPDVVVLLPDNNRIVIDSKVSLTAYTEYNSLPEGEERRAAGKRHIESVKRHIEELSTKNYQGKVANAAEHVLMFMPVEGAYFAMMQIDPEIWKYAYDRHVVIVSPTHVFSTMQIIAQLWRQDAQNKNAETIAKLGGLLYDRIATVMKEFESLQKSLRQTDDAFESCWRQLVTSPQSVVRRAERLRELGAKTSRKMSDRVLEESGTVNALPDGEPE